MANVQNKEDKDKKPSLNIANVQMKFTNEQN